MNAGTGIHDVVRVTVEEPVTRATDSGKICHWRDFIFETRDGGIFKVTAFADDPARLEVINSNTKEGAA